MISHKENPLQVDGHFIEQVLLFLSFFLLPVSVFGQEKQRNANLQVGIIADAQYADVKGGRRKYRKSLRKLTACVQKFNQEGVDLTIQLGDLIDRRVKNFKPVLSRLNRMDNPVYHVLGNHDFSIRQSGDVVPDLLNLDHRYYQFQLRNWTFVVLDGNDLSTFAWPKSSDRHQRARQMRKKLKKTGAPNAKSWNGGIGRKQKKWFRTVLKQADRRNRNVIVLCHYPVYPTNVHNLYNDNEIIEILETYSSPVAYLSGHNHGGNYGRKNGIHYLTLKGMVDTNKNSFAILELSPNRLTVRGFGREKDRTLALPEKSPR